MALLHHIQNKGDHTIMTIGSARIDEHGKATGGKAGDQKQKTTPDYKGEGRKEALNWHI